MAAPPTRGRRPGLYWAAGVYAALCVSLWGVPLFNRLHVESMALLAAAAFFVAGYAAYGAFERGSAFRAVLGTQAALLAVPLVLMTVPVFWAPNCGYLLGLLFFGLFPVVTVGLAVAVAYACTGLGRGRFWIGALGLAVAALGPLYDLGFHPQFYTYNHVFGGVLGPIYDEELAIRPGLFAFRGLTVLWAVLAWHMGQRARAQGPAWRGGLLLLAIGACYLGAAPLGINTPSWHLQRALGGAHRTPHFILYYDPAQTDSAAVRRLADDHEFRYAQLAERLGLTVDAPIASYLYPSSEVKARLTGARNTSVAPVWLADPQVHILLPRYDGVFTHELAHVFSRPFGLPVLNASWSVGLVEGLAVALEPPDGRPSPDEQVAVVALRGAGADAEAAWTAVEERLVATLSPQGFWTGRGAVSYTTMGSFVSFLLHTYGPEPFKAAYATSAFEAAYGVPVDSLARAWTAHLRTQPLVTRSAEALASRRFSVPSLFEVRCPHHVPRYVRATRRGLDALRQEDWPAAEAAFDEALDQQPRYVSALSGWAQARLAQGDPASVRARLDTVAAPYQTTTLHLRRGDAWALLGEAEAARQAYAQALRRTPLYAHTTQAILHLRHAVADQPAVVEILVVPTSPAAQAERLRGRPDTSPAAAWWIAWRQLQAGDGAAAYERLRALPPLVGLAPTAQALLERRRQVWASQALAQAGAHAEAAAWAEAAAHAYARLGEVPESARLLDAAARSRWIQQATPRVSSR
ncbi:MAG: hypothetical protein AAGI71_03480 [Bacteroidota bacterium]